MADSRLAATAGSASSIPVLSGTTSSTPLRSRARTDVAFCPRSAMSISTQSSTVCASGPIVSSVRESGKDAAFVDPPLARLEPDNAAEARRRPDRAAGVAADRAGRKAAGDRDRRARRGASRDARRRRVARVSRRAEMRVEPERRESEFRKIGLAQRHHAGRRQIRDDRRVLFLRRRGGEERRPSGGALAAHVDKVLPGDGNAIERPGRAPLAVTRAARRRFFKRALARDDNERRIVAVARDAVQEKLRDVDRVEAAFRDMPPDFSRGTLFQVVDHMAPSLPRPRWYRDCSFRQTPRCMKERGGRPAPSPCHVVKPKNQRAALR